LREALSSWVFGKYSLKEAEFGKRYSPKICNKWDKIKEKGEGLVPDFLLVKTH